jgi:hypothetical protein
MSRDKAEADQLAPAHFIGTDHRAAFGAPTVCGVRWTAALGQAVAIGRRAREAVRTARVRLGSPARYGVFRPSIFF